MNIKYERLFFFLVLIGLYSSCTKSHPAADVRSALLGEWELTRTYGGGIAGEVHYMPGNGNSLQFTSSQYKFYKSFQLYGSGDYILSKDTIYQTPSSDSSVYNVIDKIIMNPTNPQYHYILVTDSTLILDYSTSASDGLESVYAHSHD
ncbi:MAG: hypothetical protein H0X41_02295 [Chitinophagaceae bacterium]|nr:hypothetical protein [Chitinophagaceae bacterium]